MIQLTVETLILASPEVCFDMARDMNAHAKTMASSGERIVACPPSGMLEMGDEVTFEARHFWIRLRLSARIVHFDPPFSFTDEMLSGAFKSLRHEHRFKAVDGGTLMTDVVALSAPFGPIGWLAERIFLRQYMEEGVGRAEIGVEGALRSWELGARSAELGIDVGSRIGNVISDKGDHKKLGALNWKRN